jgi:DNA-binding PadR family transcriptional regulator
MSASRYAILGMLRDRSAYPYQVADQLEQRLGPAWKVNPGQVYKTIKALEQDGLVQRVRDVPADREDRHVFQITEEGVVAFERWFAKTAEVRLNRRPLLVQITFAGPQHLREAIAKVDAYELECAKQLKEITGAREALPGDGALVRADRLLLRLNFSADVSQLEGELRWARHAREMLSWLASAPDAVWPSDRGPSQDRQPSENGSVRRELFERMAREESDGAGEKTARKRSEG